MAVALAGGIFGIGFWIWRRRRTQKASAESGEGGYPEDRKELPGDLVPEQAVYHEMGEQQHSELDASAKPYKAETEKRGAEAHELPTDANRLSGPP